LSSAHEVCAASRGRGDEKSGAARPNVPSMSAAPEEPATFNLDLSDDQRDIRDWVHGFAADVVRPAASE
jgi:hypothetical protein